MSRWGWGFSFLGYFAYYFELRSTNNYMAKGAARMTPEELDYDISSDVRYADRKWTFMYGL